MPNQKAIHGEMLPVLERSAAAVREHVTGHYDAFPDRLYYTLSRMTRDDYAASHFYTVALALHVLPEADAAALLAFLEDEYEDAHGGDPAPLEEALQAEGVGDGLEDGDQQLASLNPWDADALRQLMRSNRLQSVEGRKLRRSIGRRLAEIGARSDVMRRPRRARSADRRAAS